MLIRPTGCVGRDLELSELAERLHGTVTDGAEVVAVVGSPGIGKTELLGALVAQHGGALWARATPWETELPGGVLAQMLQDVVRDDPVDAAAQLVERLRGPEPVLLIIDDAEHADTESLQAISTLVRHQRELPVLVVLAMSSVSCAPADLAAEQLALTGLSEQTVAALASSRGRTLHPSVVGALTRHTAGNPRDVLALLDEVPDSVWSQPDAVLPAPSHRRTQTRDRLADCTPEGRSLVEALAILGDDCSLADATALAGLVDPLPAVDSATTAGLLIAATPFEPRLRDSATHAAVIDLMGVQAVADAHRRAADIVADPVQRLGHLVAATPTPDSALADDVARLAHDRGTEGAWAQAATLFRDAARLTADPLLRDERLTRSVDALVAAGDCVAAAAKVPAVENLRETPLRNAVLAYLAILRGRAAEAEFRLERAWNIVNAERDPDTAALVAQRHVLHSLIRCRGDELVAWADRALGLADSDSPAGHRVGSDSGPRTVGGRTSPTRHRGLRRSQCAGPAWRPGSACHHGAGLGAVHPR